MIETYPLLERLSEFFPGELKQYREIVANASTYSETTGIEFGKTIEMVGFPGNPRLEIYASLRITGSDPSLKVRSVGLSGLLDVPIALGRLRHIVFGDRVDVLEFETTYTFFEFIDGIAWELGFLTTPGECQIGR